LHSDDIIASDIINPAVRSRLADLSERFRAARPFRHVIIDNFLRPEVAEAMLREFPRAPDPSKLLNEFGEPNPKSQISDMKSLGGTYAKVDRAIQTSTFLALMQQLTDILGLNYDPHYYGAGTHENFHGAGLDPHYDFNIHPVTSQHRRLNAIVYLNKAWDPQWGGSICFHSDPWDLRNDKVVEVEPIFNRCAVFETTERSWHSVSLVNLPPERRAESRKSFTIYLYTDKRPAEELAPGHGTVYVQAALPKHIRAGQTLTPADEELIHANLARRNAYLRILYKREYRFAEHIDGLMAQIEELKRATGFPLVGYGKIKSVAAPLYADGFMGKAAELSVTPLRPVTALKLFGYRPDTIGREVEVSLEAGGRVEKKRVGVGGFELDLQLPTLQKGVFAVRIVADRAERPVRGGDLRELSLLVDRLELIH
jgi:Rps23 Pro-64 3,4-dihydroxylase Tpa1-like proline 4-hydroxylase